MKSHRCPVCDQKTKRDIQVIFASRHIAGEYEGEHHGPLSLYITDSCWEIEAPSGGTYRLIIYGPVMGGKETP